MFQDSDILLCKSNGLIPKLIKWGTESVYSHVAVIASAKLGLIIEAIPEGGVRAISVQNYKTPFDVYRIKSAVQFNTSGVISYLIKMLARKYDYPLRLAWKMALRKFRLLKLFGLKVMKKKEAADQLQEDQDYFCSELVYQAFFIGGGVDIVPQIGDAETTSPGDIAKSSVVEKVQQ
ncbi:MAG: hypothetical protein HYS55_01955 [Candidatus Omnitrophica bacterium]|nr:hypothetical protein [Candidatus Omnitrophota bacterium]